MLARLQKSMNEKDKGFTLIELLVVIVIVGILAAIAIPLFLSQREKGVDASMKSDLKNAATAAETYATDNPTATSYGATPADIKTNLVAAGFKATTGNTVAIKGSPASGYCIRASNPGGTTDATFFHFDSENGGLAAGEPTATAAGGACGGVATGFEPIS